MILLAILSCAATAPTAAPVILNAPPSAAPSGAGCSKTSCSLGDAVDHSLEEDEFVALLEQWSTEPLGESTLALDTLLFDAERSTALLSEHGDRLEPSRRAFLERELARTEVIVEMRLVDDKGEIRGRLSSANFPLRDKQHLPFADTGSLGWLETGGKVKRVGLGHLWSRW